jgi:hypothetical protein
MAYPLPPQISQKFKSQRVDRIKGNDLCYDSFGPNAEWRHKHFRCFFAYQNPVLEVPSTKTHPKYKADPFLLWMQTVLMDAWTLASMNPVMSNASDLQAIIRISSESITKKDGDGFLAESICKEGYTYSFFFRISQHLLTISTKAIHPLTLVFYSFTTLCHGTIMLLG